MVDDVRTGDLFHDVKNKAFLPTANLTIEHHYRISKHKKKFIEIVMKAFNRFVFAYKHFAFVKGSRINRMSPLSQNYYHYLLIAHPRMVTRLNSSDFVFLVAKTRPKRQAIS